MLTSHCEVNYDFKLTFLSINLSIRKHRIQNLIKFGIIRSFRKRTKFQLQKLKMNKKRVLYFTSFKKSLLKNVANHFSTSHNSIFISFIYQFHNYKWHLIKTNFYRHIDN